VTYLAEVDRMTDDVGELVESVPLEEHAPIVAELLRRDLVAVRDLQFADLHPGRVPSPRPEVRPPHRPGSSSEGVGRGLDPDP
jgi:hypothetical protein